MKQRWNKTLPILIKKVTRIMETRAFRGAQGQQKLAITDASLYKRKISQNCEYSNPDPAPEVPAPMELVRLTIHRRVYTQSHMDFVVEAILQVYQDRQMILAMKIVYEAPFLRHFTARFEPDG